MELTTIQCIIEDVALSNKEIEDKYGISREVGYAIRYCSGGMQLESIRYKLSFLQPCMKSQDIIGVMNGNY